MNIPPCKIPPPPLKKHCNVCWRKINCAHVNVDSFDVKNDKGNVVASLPGGFLLIDPVFFCPSCGRKLKEVTE